jgi:hypothetical protein
MNSAPGTSGLRLVHSRRRERVCPSAFLSEDAAAQISLFPQPKPGMVVFVHFSEIEDIEFIDVMNSAQPAHVFDMRLVPRFDTGILNRSRAFELFEKLHASYFDATAPLMTGADREAALRRLTDLLRSGRVDMRRPMVFLLASRERSIASDSDILSLLADAGKKAEEVLSYPD